MRGRLLKLTLLKLACVAAALWQIGDIAQAQSGLGQLEDFDYWQRLCQLHLGAAREPTDYTEAQLACEQAIQLRPNEASLWITHSEILLKLEKYPAAIASAERALSLEAQNTIALSHQCLAYAQLGQTETALTFCDQVIELEQTQTSENEQSESQPDEQEDQQNNQQSDQQTNLSSPLERALRYRGETLTQAEQYEQALSVYEQLLLADPADSLSLAYRCRTQVSIQRYQEAIETCQQALAGNGRWQAENPSIAHTALAESYLNLGQVEAAVQSYDLALEADPQNAEIWIAQGQLLQEQRQFTPALTSYTRAVELMPMSSRALLGQCAVMNRLADYEAAESACQQSIQGDSQWWKWGEAQAWNQQGQSLSGQGKQAEALASLNRAVGMQPNYADAWNNQSVVYWYMGNLRQAEQDTQAALNAYRQAITSAEKAIGLTANFTAAPVADPAVDPAAEPVADNHGLRAVGQMQANLGRYHRTLAEFYSNLSMPDNAAIHFRRALTAYDQAIELVPEDAETWVNKSVVLWLLGNYTQANDAANQAVKLDSTLVEAWQTQGTTLVALGHFAQARVSYQEVLRRDHENAEAWAGLGVVNLQLEDREAGLEALQRALALDPAQPLALKTLSTIEAQL